jgi:hypothetical protein
VTPRKARWVTLGALLALGVSAAVVCAVAGLLIGLGLMRLVALVGR